MERDDLKRLGVDGYGIDWVQALSFGSAANLRVLDTKLTTDGAVWRLDNLKVLNNTVVLQKYRTIDEMVLPGKITLTA